MKIASSSASASFAAAKKMTLSRTKTMQSELSYCNLEEEAAPPPDVLKYKQEIEAHNVFDSVLESPTKNRRKSLQDTPLDEILVSVTSWSDVKGHTDYVISTSVIGCAFVTTSRR